jgi:hypothetical protein
MRDVIQPVGNVYVTLVVPAATPETIPDADPIVATDVSADCHVPPPSALVNVVVDATHTSLLPAIAAGKGLTVTTAVR